MSVHRRFGVMLIAGFAALALAACDQTPVSPDALVTTPENSAGHGAPKGSHLYQLNIIGVPEGNSGGIEDNQGRRIFVPIEGSTRIYLFEGDDFEVLDSHGLDGRAEFQMPDPDLHFDPETLTLTDAEASYSVFIRALGKPGGEAQITTCAELIDELDLRGREARSLGPDAECSLEPHSVTLESQKGNKKFQNVTSELLTLSLELFEDDEPTGIVVQVPIFSDLLEGVFWEYENQGLRLAQVRFYACATNVETGDSTCFDE